MAIISYIWDWCTSPFIEFLFMRRALVGCLCFGLTSAVLGAFLILRRMSLVGDALSHGLLPGIALAFVWYGMSMTAMTVGGLVAGLAVALLSGYISKRHTLYEEASLAGMYLTSMALGIFILSVHGSHVDLLHILFGSVLSVSQEHLVWIGAITTITFCVIALFYKDFVVECFDAVFYDTSGGSSKSIHLLFLLLVTLNMVASFQTLGTLMSLGLLLLPNLIVHHMFHTLKKRMFAAAVVCGLGSYVGLLCSFYGDLPSGPCIVLVLGGSWVLSLIAKGWQRASCASQMGVKTNAQRMLVIAGCACVLCQASHSGCAKDCNGRDHNRSCSHVLHVFATFSITADMVKQIGGDKVYVHGAEDLSCATCPHAQARVKVKALVGPNGDVHTYEPKPKDALLLTKASLVVFNGLGFDVAFEKLFKRLKAKGMTCVVSQGVKPRYFTFGKGHKIVDPHAWHSVENARIYARNIAQCLVRLMPQHRDFLLRNLKRYDERLKTLDAWIRDHMNKIPLARRVVLTHHDGFGYYAQAYNVQCLYIAWSTATDPSARDVARLIQRIRTKQVRALFFENIANNNAMNQIARETRMKIGGQLYSDALSESSGPAANYIDMMIHNTRTFVSGLL